MSWSFLTNHAHVVLILAANPDTTLREVARLVGITERAAHRIVSELESEGALRRFRVGRQNHYEVCTEFPLRHSLEEHCSLAQLIEMVSSRGDD